VAGRLHLALSKPPDGEGHGGLTEDGRLRDEWAVRPAARQSPPRLPGSPDFRAGRPGTASSSPPRRPPGGSDRRPQCRSRRRALRLGNARLLGVTGAGAWSTKWPGAELNRPHRDFQPRRTRDGGRLGPTGARTSRRPSWFLWGRAGALSRTEHGQRRTLLRCLICTPPTERAGDRGRTGDVQLGKLSWPLRPT